ncbi:MAG: hypothetical protein M1831_001171 [Alyxoria varia]|nr:MAG: hypothetical protein M1831_001171 [Alyxoria varia]
MSSAATARTPFMKIVSNLNEADKNRIICVCLHSKVTDTDMKAAAEAFGSASTNSMATMYGTAMKKAREARASLTSAGDLPQPNGKANGTPSKTKGKGAKSANGAGSGGQKRKATGNPRANTPPEGEDDEELPPTPISNKKPKMEVKKDIKQEDHGNLADSLLASDKPLA